MSKTPIIAITGHDLTLETVARVACPAPSGAVGQAPPGAVCQPPEADITVTLSDRARTAIARSRAVIEQVLASGKTVYGVNTGFGALSNVRISDADLNALQANLVRSHAAGTGGVLATPAIRAMMLLRANTLAKGFSGVRPVIVETLLAMLNARVHPQVPSQGSLGASGDLAPLAHLALVLMGEGKAEYRGEILPGAEALARAGLSPVTLKAKEGLALLNGTQMMTAVGILALLEAEHLADIADLAGAMTIEAVKGSHHPFDPRIASVRPHPGHEASAANIRRLLSNSEIARAHADCGKVQDAYSLRCIPQVHGAVRDVLSRVRDTLTIEANAATDNPLIFPDGESFETQVLSQGNFHGEPVAMVLDQLGVALAELASISERRIDKLMNPVFSELPAFLIPGADQAGLQSGLMIVHYTAASLVSENKILAHPASVDSIPTSNDKEDHVSMGATAARKAARILVHTRWVLAAELFAATCGLDFERRHQPGVGVARGAAIVREVVPPVTADRVFADDVAALVSLIERRAFVPVFSE